MSMLQQWRERLPNRSIIIAVPQRRRVSLAKVLTASLCSGENVTSHNKPHTRFPHTRKKPWRVTASTAQMRSSNRIKGLCRISWLGWWYGGRAFQCGNWWHLSPEFGASSGIGGISSPLPWCQGQDILSLALYPTFMMAFSSTGTVIFCLLSWYP